MDNDTQIYLNYSLYIIFIMQLSWCLNWSQFSAVCQGWLMFSSPHLLQQLTVTSKSNTSGWIQITCIVKIFKIVKIVKTFVKRTRNRIKLKEFKECLMHVYTHSAWLWDEIDIEADHLLVEWRHWHRSGGLHSVPWPLPGGICHTEACKISSKTTNHTKANLEIWWVSM